jgi:hypothetical protein
MPGRAALLEGHTIDEHDIEAAVQLAKTGVGVMLFDVSRWSANIRPRDFSSIAGEFIQSECAMHFARNALNFMEARAPMIDMKRIYAYGRGGSARVMLNYAAIEPRIRGVAAVEPMCDPMAHVEGSISQMEMEIHIAKLEKFLNATSPLLRANQIKCPVLLLTAEQEAQTPDLIGETIGDAAASGTATGAATGPASRPANEVDAFASAVKAAGGKVTADKIKKVPDVNPVEGLMGQVSRWVKSFDGKGVFSE